MMISKQQLMKDILIDSHYVKDWLKFARLKDSTKKNQLTYLRKFERFIIEQSEEVLEEVDFNKFYFYEDAGEFGPIDPLFIDEYFERSYEDLTDHGQYINICTIKGFFTFLKDMDLIATNPVTLISNTFYKPVRRDRSLSNDQCNKLMLAANELEPFTKQYAVLFLLEITCGLRAKELVMLKKSQIDFQRKCIFINRGQKTSKNTVFMHSTLCQALYEYINHPHWLTWSNGKDREIFFLNNKPLNYQKLRNVLDSIVNKAKMEIGLTPHQLRHTMARLMFESGIDIILIQRQLRHKRIATTFRYLPPSTSLTEYMEKNAIEI